jgi:hypothetical protein
MRDQVVASAMIDRSLHHAKVVTLEHSNRLKHAQTDSLPSTRSENAVESPTSTWLIWQPAKWVIFRSLLHNAYRAGMRP